MAKFVDTFTIDWSQFFFYAYPPFCLVSRCVQKITHDQASGILVIPLWTTQPYFSVVLSLLTETPRVFNASVQNLIHPTLDGPYPLHQRLQLMVCKLSGDPCKSPRFHQTLLTSCIHGDSTQKQYKVYINKWLQFCTERPQDLLHPTVTAVLSFLHSLFKSGLSYSALNTARSAVSNIDMSNNDAPSHTPVGKHFLVCRYLRGVFNKLKPVPKYNNIWSVDTVPDYLSLFWPLHEINLKELTLKLVMLIALTTGQRCQTLTFSDTSEQYMQKNMCFNFALTEHIKQDKPGKVFGNVRLYKYPVRELCL